MTEVRQLQRMEWALKETERLHPVAFVLMRKAAETLTWQGFRIPQDTMVFVAPTLSHRMPEVFPDPDQYRPERFSPAHDESRQPHSLIGFGGGVHRCAGVNFARLEMKIVLSLLLQRYELTLLDPAPFRGEGSKDEMAGQPVSGPIPAPGFHATQGAASCAARRRSPSRRSTGRALSGSPLSVFVPSSESRCLQKGLDSERYVIGNELDTGILPFRPASRRAAWR